MPLKFNPDLIQWDFISLEPDMPVINLVEQLVFVLRLNPTATIPFQNIKKSDCDGKLRIPIAIGRGAVEVPLLAFKPDGSIGLASEDPCQCT